jgi:Protein of unknown function (DUF3223)
MAKPVRLNNGREWKTRKLAIEHFRMMLARYKDGDRITDLGDDGDLRALIALYDSVLQPGEPTKAGSGIAFFSRELNTGDGWATSGFHVHRTDGSTIDFSFHSAVRTDSIAK